MWVKIASNANPKNLLNNDYLLIFTHKTLYTRRCSQLIRLPVLLNWSLKSLGLIERTTSELHPVFLAISMFKVLDIEDAIWFTAVIPCPR
jgi:hypothetical protein